MLRPRSRPEVDSGGRRGIRLRESRPPWLGWACSCFCVLSSVRGPVACSDSGLYYVLCDKGCLMVDRGLSGAPALAAPVKSSPRCSGPLCWAA